MTVTTMQRLRAETRAAHARLEDSIDLDALTATPDRYRALLAGFYGFHAAVEPGATRSLEGLYSPVPRAALLERDLQALGVHERGLEVIPRCEDLPDHDSPARAFGVAYVLEGSALGGQIVGRIIKDRLGYDREQGASFFLSDGRHVGEDWRTFGKACDDYFQRCPGGDEAVMAAEQTFESIRIWFRSGGLA